MKNAYNTSAYGSFAYVYDIFMDNVNYREWTEYIVETLAQDEIIRRPGAGTWVRYGNCNRDACRGRI